MAARTGKGYALNRVSFECALASLRLYPGHNHRFEQKRVTIRISLKSKAVSESFKKH